MEQTNGVTEGTESLWLPIYVWKSSAGQSWLLSRPVHQHANDSNGNYLNNLIHADEPPIGYKVFTRSHERPATCVVKNPFYRHYFWATFYSTLFRAHGRYGSIFPSLCLRLGFCPVSTHPFFPSGMPIIAFLLFRRKATDKGTLQHLKITSMAKD